MNEHDPLIAAIRAAGEVPPPPDRDAAFARAMHPVLMPSRRRLSRSFIALFAAALLAAPAAVFAAHATHTPAVVQTPIVSERPDPESPIRSEADDAALNHETQDEQEIQHAVATSPSSDDHTAVSSGTDDHSGTGSTSSGSDSTSDSGSGSGDHATVSPTPTESSGSGSSGDGGTSSDGGSSISSSTDGGTPGSH